jgi:hypothetical protein
MVTSGVMAMALAGKIQTKPKHCAHALASDGQLQKQIYFKGLIG